MIVTSMFLLAASAQQSSAAQSVPQVRREASIGVPRPTVSGSDTCLKLSMVDGLPVIPIKIGGKSLNIVLDTGAPGTVLLSSDIIQQLKLAKIGEALVSDPTLQNPKRVGLYLLADVQAGDLAVENLLASDLPQREKRIWEEDGVMGPDAFPGYVITYDYPGGRVLLKKGRLPPADGRTAFSYEGSTPGAQLNVDGRTIKADIDTGNARYGLILPKEFAATLPAYSKQFPVGVAHTANNKYDFSALPVADAKLGDVPLYIGLAAYPSPAKTANVGSYVLRDFVLRVDSTNKIVSLERAAPGLETGCSSA